MWVVLEAEYVVGERAEVDPAASHVGWKVQACWGIWRDLRAVLWVYEKAPVCGAWCQLIERRGKQNDIANPNSEEEVPQDVRADRLRQAVEPVFSRRHLGEPLLQTSSPREFAHQSQRRRGPTKPAADVDNRWTPKDPEQSHRQLGQTPLHQRLRPVQAQ